MISAGVLGSPISHSLSPLLHSTAYGILDIDAQYAAYEVVSGGLSDFLDSKGNDLNCLSLTMPLKEEALEIADIVSDLSSQIASGNTLYKSNSQWNLTSTDVEGFTHSLHAHGLSAQGRVLIIGSGATARAVGAACDGVSDSVTVIHRNHVRVDSMRKSVPSLELEFLRWEDRLDLGRYDLVVNTTPGDAATYFVEAIKPDSGIFFEVLYNPWPTPMLSKWRERGNFGIDGLDLLIHQAISQVEIFSLQVIDRASMARSLRLVAEKVLP